LASLNPQKKSEVLVTSEQGVGAERVTNRHGHKGVLYVDVICLKSSTSLISDLYTEGGERREMGEKEKKREKIHASELYIS
jgi:hypothetical protein